MMWIFVGAAALLLFLMDRLALSIIRPPWREPTRSPADVGLSFDEVAFPSGKLTLRGWVVEPDAPRERPLVILVHGWSANAGGMLELALPLAEAGYPLLLFDFRRHGRSDAAPYITIRQYRDDVLAAVEYAEGRFPGRRRVIVGHSMGGGTAMVVAANPGQADAVVAIAAPADILDVTATYLDDKHLPGRLIAIVLAPFWWRRTRMLFRTLAPERVARRLGVPALVLAAETDHRIPADHPDRLARAARAFLHVIAGSDHTDILVRDETHQQVLRFLERVFAESEHRN